MSRISHAYVGDRVIILPGAAIGQPGFGFTTNGADYLKVPQLGRVIIQDDVEIGANTTIDRGALSDTVIGEGSKLDNLIMIAHNCRIGRNCVIAGQTGLAGSVVLEDGVVLAGQVGLGDHSRVGAGARMGARVGNRLAHLPGGRAGLWRGAGETCKRMGPRDSCGDAAGPAAQAGQS